MKRGKGKRGKGEKGEREDRGARSRKAGNTRIHSHYRFIKYIRFVLRPSHEGIRLFSCYVVVVLRQS